MRCLPCGHEFHKSCVDSWLENNASCPSCRHSFRDLVSLTTSTNRGQFSFLSRSTSVSSSTTNSTTNSTDSTPQTNPDDTVESSRTTRRPGLLAGAFSPVLSGRIEILRNGRRNRSQVSQVQMTEIIPQSPPGKY